jgi:hypothetical protein
MHAHPGDQLVIRNHHVGEPERKGEVLETRGPDGTQPFLVRWDESGHVTLFYPGTDCHVETLREKVAS